MGGIKSAVSMGYAVVFVILLYLVGIGISSLIQYIKNNRECSNMYYFDHFNCNCFVFNPCDDP